jgi:phage-related protein
VEFYEEEDGSAPAEEDLEKFPKPHISKPLAIVRLLEEHGPTLPFPYSSHVRGKIWELRTQHGCDRIRILYFCDSRSWFILLHSLIKRTPKLGERDIRTAEKRMNNHNSRLERRRHR